jgi:peptide/nickel transport system ATP-binding protein
MMTIATAHPAIEAGEPLLMVDDLRTYFDLRQGVVKAVDGVSSRLRHRRRSPSWANPAAARA